MHRTDRRHHGNSFPRDHILAIYFQVPETTIASLKNLIAGLLEAFYPTMENVNNALVQRNSPAHSGEAAAPLPAGTSVKR
jgi:hypothetical protein